MKDLKKKQLEEGIGQRDKTIQDLRRKIEDIQAGNFDTDIQSEIKAQTETYHLKKNVAKKKVQDLLIEDEEKKQKFNLQPREENDRKNTKDYAYFFKVYNKINDSIPTYMRENLKDMPNNKGYIWRGCWCLGEKKAEKNQPTVLFEKLKGNITRIHEYDGNEYRLFEKVGKDKKKLVSCEKRLNRKMARIKY